MMVFGGSEVRMFGMDWVVSSLGLVVVRKMFWRTKDSIDTLME